MLSGWRDRVTDLMARAGMSGSPTPAAVAGALVVAALVCVVLLRSAGGGPEAGVEPVTAGAPGDETAAAPASRGARDATPSAVVVHVVGGVRRPGVYRLPEGSRAEDAVRAAGGTTADAVTAALNLARVLQDGEQLAVPTKGEASPSAPAGAPSSPAAPGTQPGAPIDLNSATAAQLDALPGVGPATAAKIVSERESNGPFKSVDDLSRVAGIGPKKLDALRDLVEAR